MRHMVSYITYHVFISLVILHFNSRPVLGTACTCSGKDELAPLHPVAIMALVSLHSSLFFFLLLSVTSMCRKERRAKFPLANGDDRGGNQPHCTHDNTAAVERFSS